MFLPVVKPVVRIVLRIITFILYFITVLAAYGGRVNPEYMTLPATLTLALPYFVIASMIATALWFCAGRWITGGIGVAVIIAAWSPISTAFPVSFSKNADNPDRTFRVLTYNILHGLDQENPEMTEGNRSFRYILDQDADLVGLQELVNIDDKAEVKIEEALLDSLKMKYPYRAGSPWTSDLKVLSKYPVKLLEESGLFSLYQIRMPWGKLNWINMHMTSFQLSDEERGVVREIMKDTRQGLQEMKGSIRGKLSDGFRERAQGARRLREVLDRYPGPMIISGDLNDVPESYAYRTIRGDDFADAYQETSFGPLVTYNRHGFYFHLDQILYRPEFMDALSVTKGRLKSSDHYPLTAEFEWKQRDK